MGMVWLDAGFFPIHYGFCPSEKDWRREMTRLGHPGAPYPADLGAATELVSDVLDSACIVTVAERGDAQFKRNKVALATLLCHEAVHVWQVIRKDMGEADPSHEFEAYAIQHITEQLCEAYLKTRGAKAAKRPRSPKKRRSRSR